MKYIENQLKAKIVKLQDKNNNFASDNVEDALNEAGNKIKNTKTIPNVSRKLQGNGILYFKGE